MKFNLNLIPDWKQAYKFLSVQIPIAGASTVMAYAQLPEDWKAAIPDWVITTCALTFFFVSMVGRIIQQNIGESK